MTRRWVTPTTCLRVRCGGGWSGTARRSGRRRSAGPCNAVHPPLLTPMSQPSCQILLAPRHIPATPRSPPCSLLAPLMLLSIACCPPLPSLDSHPTPLAPRLKPLRLLCVAPTSASSSLRMRLRCALVILQNVRHSVCRGATSTAQQGGAGLGMAARLGRTARQGCTTAQSQQQQCQSSSQPPPHHTPSAFSHLKHFQAPPHTSPLPPHT